MYAYYLSYFMKTKYINFTSQEFVKKASQEFEKKASQEFVKKASQEFEVDGHVLHGVRTIATRTIPIHNSHPFLFDNRDNVTDFLYFYPIKMGGNYGWELSGWQLSGNLFVHVLICPG